MATAIRISIQILGFLAGLTIGFLLTGGGNCAVLLVDPNGGEHMLYDLRPDRLAALVAEGGTRVERCILGGVQIDMHPTTRIWIKFVCGLIAMIFALLLLPAIPTKRDRAVARRAG